jgi:hypothetical protein
MVCETGWHTGTPNESGLSLIFPQVALQYASERPEMVKSHVEKSSMSATCAAVLCMSTLARAGSDVAFIAAMAPLIQHVHGSASLLPIASRGNAARQARMKRCMQSWDPARTGI